MAAVVDLYFGFHAETADNSWNRDVVNKSNLETRWKLEVKTIILYTSIFQQPDLISFQQKSMVFF